MTMPPIEVKYGDRFRCGPHLFQCGDLLAPNEWESLLKAWKRFSPKKPIRWVYSDPPWNAGNLRWWRNLAGYDAPTQDYGRFAERYAECIALIQPTAVYCEQSVRDPDTMILAAARLPAFPPLRGRYIVRYGAPTGTGDHIVCCRRPNLVLRFADHEWNGDPTDLAGQKVTEHVFDREPVARDRTPVADPCVGKGMTARVAHNCGVPCLGMELNPKRLAVTLAWLTRRGLEILPV
jgi:hypothetical protein